MILRKEHTMYEIEFYEDKNGKSEIADYIKELNAKAASSKPSCARQRMRHHPWKSGGHTWHTWIHAAFGGGLLK